MNPCPHCGSRSGFVVAARVAGPIELFYTFDGDHDETNFDRAREVPYSSAVRCVDCYRIRRDVRREGREIVEVEDHAL